MNSFKTWMIEGKEGISGERIILLVPERDEDYFSLGERKGRILVENLGVVHLASYLSYHGWEFKLAQKIDSSTLQLFSPGSHVGISTQINNYGNALRLAKIAKKNSCKSVILGGPHATNLADQIMENKKNEGIIDYVVRGQGEEALRRIISCEIPRGVIEEIHLPLEKLPQRIRQLWPQGVAHLWGGKMSLAHFSEGCPQALSKNACIFCSLLQAQKYSRRSIPQVIDELLLLRRMKYEALEISDDDFPASFGKGNLKVLANEMKKKDLNFLIYIHARIRSCTRDTLEVLRGMGVSIIQTGLETVVPQLKKECANKSGLKEEEEFFKNCQDLGIKLHLSVVFGLKGETKETIEKTCETVLELNKKGLIWGFQADPLLPLPGSEAYNLLCNDHPELLNADWVDIQKLMMIWFERYTEVTLEYTIARRRKLFEAINPEAVAGLILMTPPDKIDWKIS